MRDDSHLTRRAHDVLAHTQGKTTLLDCLARRKTLGTITGKVEINGLPQDDTFKRMSGYVEQVGLWVLVTGCGCAWLWLWVWVWVLV